MTPFAPSAIEQTKQPDEKQVQTPIVNVYIAGNVVDHDVFARELVPSITKALSDNANQ